MDSIYDGPVIQCRTIGGTYVGWVYDLSWFVGWQVVHKLKRHYLLLVHVVRSVTSQRS